MERLLDYNNREEMYRFLIDDFGLVLVQEKYEKESFGNFFVDLAARNFLLRYVNDREYLTIEISSRTGPNNWLDLSFIRDFIYDPDHMNNHGRRLDNFTRISELNDFIIKDFDLISNWFSEMNYKTNLKKLNELLDQAFDRNFPGKRMKK